MANENKKLDLTTVNKLPVFLQALIGIGLLVVVAALGFAALYLIDFVLLDADPVGKLISTISGAIKK